VSKNNLLPAVLQAGTLEMKDEEKNGSDGGIVWLTEITT
jgi:hypothetical protein